MRHKRGPLGPTDGWPLKTPKNQKVTVLYRKKIPAGKFQKIPGKFQKWACAAREARGARPFLGIFPDFLEFSGIFFHTSAHAVFLPRRMVDSRVPWRRLLGSQKHERRVGTNQRTNGERWLPASGVQVAIGGRSLYWLAGPFAHVFLGDGFRVEKHPDPSR